MAARLESPARGGNTGKTKSISVFVDYMVCLVFHDQDSDISGEISKFEEALAVYRGMP